uniref:Uncharacterized protein n=1 Tax=Timema shepardi TaxID=629360 RepID=A0A7R9G389_TIMSH|nr:unnamed protein product [Timema shepardi]
MIRTLISPSSAVELNTTSALANYATEAVFPVPSWSRPFGGTQMSVLRRVQSRSESTTLKEENADDYGLFNTSSNSFQEFNTIDQPRTSGSWLSDNNVQPSRKHVERKPENELLGTIESVLQELKELRGKVVRPDKDNSESELFGKFVACQLQKLPETVALTAMEHIQSYLFKQRMIVNNSSCFTAGGSQSSLQPFCVRTNNAMQQYEEESSSSD